MLQSLHVHNFALLEDAHADFTPGFNVFTGETGAGKSILIDAFGMVLGGRASVDYVRSGTEGLWVQAVFDITNQEDIKNILREQGLEAEDDLFLTRGRLADTIYESESAYSFLSNSIPCISRYTPHKLKLYKYAKLFDGSESYDREKTLS